MDLLRFIYKDAYAFLLGKKLQKVKNKKIDSVVYYDVNDFLQWSIDFLQQAHVSSSYVDYAEGSYQRVKSIQILFRFNF